MSLQPLFASACPVIGVVHLLPLPTSPRWGGSLKVVIDRAEQEATALAAGGVDGIIVENFFDAPFTKSQVDPAVVSGMTLVIQRLKNLVTVPLGINVLRNDAHSGLAIAACTGCQFIRVNVLTGVMATDQGLIEGQAHHLLRYRRELGQDIKIFADVLVKHARPLGSPNLTTAVADTIQRGLADGVILSGWATGSPPSQEDLELSLDAAKGTPVFIGSGATWENIPDLIRFANGVIVASSLKRQGKIEQPVDPIRVSRFVAALRHALATEESIEGAKELPKSATSSMALPTPTLPLG
ncbi:BtpA/SgcQ family protein [Thermosynechococcaceae cyanobacterium BACA0444]|uniref:BtpA/SgcQ family protein n=1 Tax=Pseudocalidococcus azoricus BACA0444 TaxID=2918990 RepID=A0AAE4FQT9_9CYAN|nr:BtpA/SgcQ family protein [Pseudocalidococcus azoricus]MDS3859330.1 BtpA/SgcQ family protein [Pseudocalidococcus azoricus BACA0444]